MAAGYHSKLFVLTVFLVFNSEVLSGEHHDSSVTFKVFIGKQTIFNLIVNRRKLSRLLVPNRAISVWQKHGEICLFLPYSFKDITIAMDVEKQPGPYSELTGQIQQSFPISIYSSFSSILKSSANDTVLNYSRQQLLALRLRSSFSLPRNLFQCLKDVGILRTRRVRAGVRVRQKLRKIQVILERRWTPNSRSRRKLAYCQHVNKRNLCQLTNSNSFPISLHNPQLINGVNSTRRRSTGQKPLRICLLNAQSVNNKSANLLDYVIHDCKPDITSITETWLCENDSALRIDCTPPGYSLLDHPRSDRRGGGTAVLFKNNITVKKVKAAELRSFEYSEWEITIKSFRLKLIIVYRPTYSSEHPISVGTFFCEFSDYLESVILCKEPLLITGDFNIHVDQPSATDTVRFTDLLDSFGLQQHVKVPTHVHGHTLDLIITRHSDNLICDQPCADQLFSDHFTVVCHVDMPRPPKVRQEITFRN